MDGVPLLSISVDSHEDELQICRQHRRYVFYLGSDQEESFWACIKHSHTAGTGGSLKGWCPCLSRELKPQWTSVDVPTSTQKTLYPVLPFSSHQKVAEGWHCHLGWGCGFLGREGSKRASGCPLGIFGYSLCVRESVETCAFSSTSRVPTAHDFPSTSQVVVSGCSSKFSPSCSLVSPLAMGKEDSW